VFFIQFTLDFKMISPNEYFVTLLSNGSQHVHTQNDVASFVNILNNPLKLSDQWVVGLTEIYLNDLAKSKRQKRSLDLVFPPEKVDGIENKKLKLSLNISESKDDDDDGNGDNEKSRSRQNEEELEDDNNNNKARLISIGYIERLIAIPLEDFRSEMIKSCANLHRDTTKIVKFIEDSKICEIVMIYTDIIKPRHTGDQFTKVLRVVPISNNPGCIKFKNIEYHPLQTNFLTDIAILITNVAGKNIDFKQTGIPTICTLHFKKV